MICSKFSFFKRKKTRSAPNAQRHMRHTLNSWNVPFRFGFEKSSKQRKRGIRHIRPKLHEQQAANTLTVNMDEPSSEYVCGCMQCMYVSMYLCKMHIYISFFCTYKQFETRIHAYLLFHVRNGNGWMHVK